MSSHAKSQEMLLREANAELRAESLDDETCDRAAARVWNRLAAAREEGAVDAARDSVRDPTAPLRGCGDFVARLGAYRRGELSAAERLLIADHLRECVACRRALAPPPLAAPGPATAPARRVWRWAAIATAFALAALGAYLFRQWAPVGGEVTVLAARGPLYGIAANGYPQPLRATTISYGEPIRTGPSADALLRLSDGSRVEVHGQSECEASATRGGIRLDLHRGAIIVQAARQAPGRHLYVQTRGALVSVVGTIFSVDSGLKGARIGVLAGTVRVDEDGHETLLRPGEQLSTEQSLAPVPLRDEFTWSRNSAHYLALLASLSSLHEALSQVPVPAQRYSSSLAALLPANTVFYAALPNLSGTVTTSYRIVQQYLATDPTLRQWWDERHPGGRPGSSGGDDTIEPALRQLAALGADLGNEIVIGLPAGFASAKNGPPPNALLLAQVANAADLRSQLGSQLAALAAGRNGDSGAKIDLLSDPLTASAVPQGEVLIWIDQDLLAAAADLAPLRDLARRLQSPAGQGFSSTPFYARISEAYQQGVSVLVAANLHAIMAAAPRHPANGLLGQLGLGDLDYFVATQQMQPGATASHANLSFTDMRTGIASWLAPPGPMGALEFVSPSAQVVVAAEVKEPSAIVDDLFGILDARDPRWVEQLNEWRGETGLNLRSDLAAPLGGPLGSEVAFALDGPLLPTPAWKAIIEVNDPGQLQEGLQRLVAEINRQTAVKGGTSLAWSQTQIGGQTVYRLAARLAARPADVESSGEAGGEIDYAYADGYLIAAPSAALVAAALRYHDAGYNLPRSQRFLAALPDDSEVNCSALLYQDLAPTLAPLLNLPAAGQLSPGQRQSLTALGEQAPTAACFYAAPSEITFAMQGSQGPLGMSLENLLGARFDLRGLMARALASGQAGTP